jgi:hypothetical protein
MTGIYALRTTWIIKKAPLESYDVSTSPSAHPSSFSTLHTQVSPFPLKIQRDGGIPYRSGWVKRFKQSTEIWAVPADVTFCEKFTTSTKRLFYLSDS